MQDRAVAASVIAGDADGFAAAYDRYAASLYARCHAVLPEPEAAEAVLDTFLVAAGRLDGLRDPDRLGPWLHAVARNECLRRLGPGGEIPADHGAEPPELPPGFRAWVLTACADNSPPGRAHRMSVGHRAGEFGPAGFPKGTGLSGPSWWRRARRHPGVVTAVAVGAALVMTAGITVAMTAGASHRPQASLRLGGGVPAAASSTAPGATSAAPSPARTAPASAHPTWPATLPATLPTGTAGAGPSPGQGTPSSSTAPPPSTSPPPDTPPPPDTSPAPGYLLVKPDNLMLTSISGKPVSGSFLLTATNGPIPQYTVRVAAMANSVKAAPVSGSLPVNGYVKVTVTVTSTVGLTTHVIVEPGNLTVTVVYKLMPQPSPSPSASASA